MPCKEEEIFYCDESISVEDVICNNCGKSYEGLHLQQIKCHKMLCVQEACLNEELAFFEEEYGHETPDFDRSTSMFLRQYYGPYCWREHHDLETWIQHNLEYHGVPVDHPDVQNFFKRQFLPDFEEENPVLV